MITLTREEAQQVLDALICSGPHGWSPNLVNQHNKALKTLRARLSAPEPEYRDVVIKGDLWRIEFLPDHAASVVLVRANYEAQPEPEPVRLRRGNILRCIETNELCTVWATSTTGKTQVKWKANDFGSYTAEQIGDLFWVEPKPEPEPVAWMHDQKVGFNVPLYTTPPQREWQGLTDEEVVQLLGGVRERLDGNVFGGFARAIEAKLREKNND
jgi:hypothetical protein